MTIHQTPSNAVMVHRLRCTVAKINRYQEQMRSLSDAALQGLTAEFRQRLAAGASLDSLLVEAFAAIREADRRVLGMFPYDVQVMGAVAMYHGRVVEMKTGEGKTLAATMPLYLVGLTRAGAFLVTPNEYLARRDGQQMGRVYRWMGESVAIGFGAAGHKPLTTAQKRARYQADITYTTNGALGFDYLFDHLATTPEQQFMRPLNFAIVDEADSILLDAATSPLIVAGSPRDNSDMMVVSDEFTYFLDRQRDLKKSPDGKQVWLTQQGYQRLADFFQIHQVTDGHHTELLRQVQLALRAHQTLERDRDYVVTPHNQVALLDQSNGRILAGMKLQLGLHQAVEVKEQVLVTPSQRTIAAVTYQSLFQRFKRLAGMTGTAKVAESELIDNYGLKVVQIPTNRPVVRHDLPDRIYATVAAKVEASLAEVKRLHRAGRPVLLATASVELSEIFDELLLRAGIPHALLNAKSAAREAAIIKEAGQPGAVTVATTMAGRGTDIRLGPGVAAKGGLAVIGTELMPAKRVELQLRGRAGRQGDPGSSQFFISLEDAVARQNGTRWLHAIARRLADNPPRRELRRHRIRRALRAAQTVSDEAGARQRRWTLAMDLRVQRQWELVDAARQQLLRPGHWHPDYARVITASVRDFYDQHAPLTPAKAQRFVWDNLNRHWTGSLTPAQLADRATAVAALTKIGLTAVHHLEHQLTSRAERDRFYRLATLKALDECWMGEADTLDQFRYLVTDRQAAQRDPLAEYYRLADEAFLTMRRDFYHRLTRHLTLSKVTRDSTGKKEVYFG